MIVSFGNAYGRQHTNTKVPVVKDNEYKIKRYKMETFKNRIKFKLNLHCEMRLNITRSKRAIHNLIENKNLCK